MIKVQYTRYDGYNKLEVQDHGEYGACSGVSWVIHAAAMGLSNMAKQYPEDIVFEFNNFDRHSDEIVVPDLRKKRARTKLR